MASRRNADPADSLLDAAFTVAGRRGWSNLTMAAIAAEAGSDLATLHAHFPSRLDLLIGLMQRTDRRVLAEPIEPDPEETIRDRLFDLLMQRFDHLTPCREGLRSALKSLRTDPLSLATLAPHLDRSMGWMLEAAGAAGTGLGAKLRAAGLALVHLRVMQTWLEDESPDLSATMAALDKALDQAEGALSSFPFFRSATKSDSPNSA